MSARGFFDNFAERLSESLKGKSGLSDKELLDITDKVLVDMGFTVEALKISLQYKCGITDQFVASTIAGFVLPKWKKLYL